MLSAAMPAAASGPALSSAAIRASMLSRSDGCDLHDVEISTSAATRSGRSKARRCATIPPCDRPMTQMPDSPSASAKAA